MRDETYYYPGGDSCSEQWKQVKFAATELVEQAMGCGYIVEGICSLPSRMLILDTIRRREWLPKEIWFKWRDELLDEKLQVKEMEKSDQPICYSLGISGDFRHSPHYRHWLHRISPQINLENIHGQPPEAPQTEQLPYLFTDRSGKAVMLEYLIKETKITPAAISLKERNVYEKISGCAALEGHPYLPDDRAFDLGIWGFPGIGTKQSAEALQVNGGIDDFEKLVNVTRAALSPAERVGKDILCSNGICTITEAILEALVGYYMAWYYLYDTQAWANAYQKAYLNPAYIEEWKLETWDGNLLIEKEKKAYWERILLLEKEKPEAEEEEEYREYITDFPMDVETVAQFIPQIWLKEGTLAIEGYGRLVLQGTYLDFWKWIYEEKQYHEDVLLTQIACYAKNDEVRANKQKLLEMLQRYDEYTVSELVLPISWHFEKPPLGYSQRRRTVAGKVEKERLVSLKEMKKFSHSFTKFSIETESAALFCQSSKEECQIYLRQIENGDLYRAFVLYYPSQRDWVMEAISLRLRILLLEDMKTFVQPEYFSLTDCIESEHKIAGIIKKVKEKVG